MPALSTEIPELQNMKKYPKSLEYSGNLDLLGRPKVSIVGTRRPSAYTKEYTYRLAKELSARGVVVVSGGAMGVDAIAHNGAGTDSTIAVLATGIDIKYPAVNRGLLEDIEQKGGLLISQFESHFKATPWSFVLRNELVVALGDLLIVTEADINSGSMRSVEYAQKMGKQIHVLSHPLNNSHGTNQLLSQGHANPIFDIEEFVGRYGVVNSNLEKDDFYYMCQNNSTLDELVAKFGHRVYEAELEGCIRVDGGKVCLA